MKTKLLLKKEQFEPLFKEWEITGIFNPGGVRMPNGKIVLFVRVAEGKKNTKGTHTCPTIVSHKEYKQTTHMINKKDIIKIDGNNVFLREGICVLNDLSHFRRVFLDETGFKVEKIEQKPIFTGDSEESKYGVEDPRITKIGNRYLMTYVSVSKKNGISTALAVSKNLLDWEKRGIIFQEQNKDAVIFPEKINGLYVALNRPETAFSNRSSIWISYSPDLTYWGNESPLIRTRDKSWEESRNGAGPPPIKTKHGWLIIYHGVKEIQKSKKGKIKHIYSAGAALLDLKNLKRVIARTPKNKPFFKPTQKYEKGEKDVIFPTTAIKSKNGKDLLIYSGGADAVISVRKIPISSIIKSLKKVS